MFHVKHCSCHAMNDSEPGDNDFFILLLQDVMYVFTFFIFKLSQNLNCLNRVHDFLHNPIMAIVLDTLRYSSLF